MVSYASLAMPYGIMINFLNVNVFNFYTDEVLLSLYYIPIVMTIYAIWNALNDPLFGLISDKISTRFGRRFPFILFGFLPFTLSFVAMWFIPPNLNIGRIGISKIIGYSNGLDLVSHSLKVKPIEYFFNIPFYKYTVPVNQFYIFLYMVSFLLIFDTLFTMVLLSWQSLFPEKFTKEKDRNYVAAITQTIRMLGSVFALVIPPIFITYGDIFSYRKPVIILVCIVFVGFLISLYGSQDRKLMIEREEQEKQVAKETQEEKISYIKAIGRVLRNKNLIAYALALGFLNIAFLILMAMMRYMNKWVLIQDPIFETAFNAVAFGVGIATFYFWIKVSLKRGPKFVYIICGTMFSVALIPLLFANENWTWITLVVMFFVGLSLSGLLLVPDILISEVVDDDKDKSGENREGLVYGFFGFTSRIAIVIESYLITLVLSISNFDPSLAVQPEGAKMGIKFLLAGVPLICFLIGNLLMIFLYDLSRKRIEKRDGKKLSLIH